MDVEELVTALGLTLSDEQQERLAEYRARAKKRQRPPTVETPPGLPSFQVGLGEAPPTAPLGANPLNAAQTGNAGNPKSPEGGGRHRSRTPPKNGDGQASEEERKKQAAELIQSFTVDGCGFIAVELPRVQWRLALVTVYLQTATGLQAEPNATIVAALLALLQRLPNWVAAGDWNVDLQQFAATNIPVVARGEVIGSPAAALPSGNTLDYVLASRSVAGLVSLQVDKAGNCCDPLRTVVLQHWRTLHRLFFARGFPDKYLRLWQLTWDKLLRAPKRWALVKGPIAAMIAYLQDHNVDASDPRLWHFPQGSLQGQGLWRFTGDTVSLQPSLSMEHQVEEALSRLLQSAANLRIAAQDAGTGASQGIDWTVPRRLLRAKTLRPSHILSLRAVWQGAFYTTAKGAKRRCPVCRCDADLRHVLLDCKWWQGRGATIPPHWAKLRQKWPSETLWVRGLPPAEYAAAPPLSPSALELNRTGVWSGNQPIDGDSLVFGTDATGTTNDPRMRIVAVAVVACSLHNGVLTEVGRLSQVLPLGCSVVQGEAYALALLLRNTTGVVATTADCKPAIAQANHPNFRATHANVWEEVWHERHRLHITWHPSHRPRAEYEELYGDSHHWKVTLNELADQACKEAAARVQWREHQARGK
eukprot:s9920_g1.t1